MVLPLCWLAWGLAGRLRKHPRGWEVTIKRLCISKDTYSKWADINKGGKMENYDAVATLVNS